MSTVVQRFLTAPCTAFTIARMGGCHKEGDDLMSATRYAVMMLRHARTDIPPKPRSIRRGIGGWMAG